MQPTAPNDDQSGPEPGQEPVERGKTRGPDESVPPNAPIVTTFGVLPSAGELLSRLVQGSRRLASGLCGLVRLIAEFVTARAVVTSVFIVIVLPTLLWWIV